jgi:hypothetical protein
MKNEIFIRRRDCGKINKKNLHMRLEEKTAQKLKSEFIP